MEDNKVDSLTDLEKEGNEVRKKCATGSTTSSKGSIPKAALGLAPTLTMGGTWGLVKDLKGLPSHESGGVQLSINNGNVHFAEGDSSVHAANGLVLPNNNKDFPEEDGKIKYVENEKDPSYKAYKDSLELYNDYIDVTEKIKAAGYHLGRYNRNPQTLKDKKRREDKYGKGWDLLGTTFDSARGKDYLEIFDNPERAANLKEELGNGKYRIQDFRNDLVNYNLPSQLFNEKIKPISAVTYVDNKKSYPLNLREGYELNYEGYIKSPFAMLTGANEDVRPVFNYSNVKPKVEVRIKDLKSTPPKKIIKKKEGISKPKKINKLKPNLNVNLNSKVSATALAKIKARPKKSYTVKNKTIKGVPESYTVYWPDGRIRYKNVSKRSINNFKNL